VLASNADVSSDESKCLGGCIRAPKTSKLEISSADDKQGMNDVADTQTKTVNIATLISFNQGISRLYFEIPLISKLWDSFSTILSFRKKCVFFRKKEE